MTRWGVLAHIHGNLPALERALSEFQERGVDRIAVLGDNLGRGNSEACVALIKEVADVSVVGNRDLDWQDRVDASARDYVLGLPRVAIDDGLAFSHGDTRLTRELSSNDIRAGFPRAQAWLTAQGCHTWVFGHTHRARVWIVDGADRAATLHYDAANQPLPAVVRPGESDPTGAIRIVNAGSVGLPFPGKGPASATIVDAVAGTVEIFPL